MNIETRLGKVRTTGYREGRKEASEETTPPACERVLTLAGYPGDTTNPTRDAMYVGYYPESQVGGDKHQVQLSGMMMGGFDAGVS